MYPASISRGINTDLGIVVILLPLLVGGDFTEDLFNICQFEYVVTNCEGSIMALERGSHPDLVNSAIHGWLDHGGRSTPILLVLRRSELCSFLSVPSLLH